jgi:hypothetical protein
MINYKKILADDSNFSTIIAKEKTKINDFLQSGDKQQNFINLYIEKVPTTFEHNEPFKDILLSSLETTSNQIAINKQDIKNLKKILNVISAKKDSLESDIDQYNTLFSKIKKNIVLVDEILEKTANSFEQFSKINTEACISNSQEDMSKVEVNEPKPESDAPINVKQINDGDSSDLLCFFPKSDKDILALSTLQDTYEILFNKENATVSIERENFNFTLKTIGVQISNNSNLLLISRKSKGFLLITNMIIDVPTCINVSKITRNTNFIEISIDNPEIDVSVNKNKVALSEGKPSISSPNLSTPNEPTITEPAKSTVDIEDIPTNTKSDKNSSTTINLMEDNNTLIISEKDDQIILPYTMEEVEKIYEKNKKKYSSVQDLIENEYILSTKDFKNPIRARFREAYQLIKKKEHGHLKEAIDLGFEVMFQSNLNPAIIAACKSLKELDIYLDCLDDNELDKFSCFNIVYKVTPSKTKK